MKSLPLTALLSLGLIAGTTALVSGCAATATHESTGQYIDDSTITTKVKAAFAHDDTVHTFDVHVETYQGVVQLSGFVDNPDEKDRAAKLASQVDGVKDVKNNIQLKQ